MALFKKAEKKKVAEVPAKKGGKEQQVFLGVKGNAQLLGMKGASAETNIWKIRQQLMKPVTWIPLIWGEGGRRRREDLLLCSLRCTHPHCCSV